MYRYYNYYEKHSDGVKQITISEDDLREIFIKQGKDGEWFADFVERWVYENNAW